MDKKIKIALVTWLGTGNFGTSLQSYALHKKLEDLGYDVCILHPFVFMNGTSFSFFRWLLYQIRRYGLSLKRIFRARTVKQQKLDVFNKENYNHRIVHNLSDYRCLLSEVDVFMTGSDQIWNCCHRFDSFMFLDFVGGEKRVAYASSIGTNCVPEKYEDRVKELLFSFQHIGVREGYTARYLSSLLGKNVSRVLDPTFLLSSQQWLDFSRKADIPFRLPSKYILCYFVGNRKEYLSQVVKVQKTLGVRDIILLPSLESGSLELYHAMVDESAGPYEFVRYVAEAEVVCTDSFHACALSVNLSKDFVVFRRFKDTEQGSQNGRIHDFLDLFGLTGRLYDDTGMDWAKPVNYGLVQDLLQKERKKSMDYLIHSIEK